MKKNHIQWIFLYICVDQITKFIANMAMDLNEEVWLIKDFFYFTDAQNFGTAFQIVEGHAISVFITLLLSLVLLFSFYHHTNEREVLTIQGILLMMGGICGNLLDRMFLHYIRDFIGISLFGSQIILNMADVFLWSGLTCIVIAEIKAFQKRQKQANKDQGKDN